MKRHRHYLITNLHHVVVRDLPLHVHAVVLTDGSNRSMRLFGAAPTWPVVDIPIPTIEHTIIAVPPKDLPPGFVPLVLRYDLVIKGFESVVLHTSNHKAPEPVVSYFEGDITRVWEAMVPAIAASWSAPNMPTLVFQPLFMIRN